MPGIIVVQQLIECVCCIVAAAICTHMTEHSVCVCVYSQLFDLLSGFETSGRAIRRYRRQVKCVQETLRRTTREGAVEPDGAMSPGPHRIKYGHGKVKWMWAGPYIAYIVYVCMYTYGQRMELLMCAQCIYS